MDLELKFVPVRRNRRRAVIMAAWRIVPWLALLVWAICKLTGIE